MAGTGVTSAFVSWGLGLNMRWRGLREKRWRLIFFFVAVVEAWS